MNYYESAFPVFASSNGVAYEIYLAGCHGYCKGCHSPHTWDFDAGTPMSEIQNKLIWDIHKQDKWCDNIVVLGGEPFDHGQEFIDFTTVLDKEFPDKMIYVYTHFPEEWVKGQDLRHIDYIKVGKYDETKLNKEIVKDPLTGVALVSSNQYFIKGDRKHE